MNYLDEIKRLKKEKDVLVLGHYYLRDELQDCVDYLGDSYGLSKKAMDFQGDMIVFAGVRFMAETAKILNPEKKVLLVNSDSGCPMADMVTGEDIIKYREKYDDLFVVCYVNSTADVKANSDVCVTSRNAVNIVKKIPEKYKNILFVPDKNLGAYVNSITNRNMILWDGYCCVHNNISHECIDDIRKKDTDGIIIVHPECKMNVIEKSDFAFSTSQMVDYAKENPNKTIYTGTEQGVIYKMKEYNPSVMPLREDIICKNMKKNTLKDLYNVLKDESNEIVLSKKNIEKALKPIELMIEWTESE